MKKSPNYRRNQSCSSLFESTQTLEALSKQGNPLEFISKMIDFEMFRPILESKLQTSERKSNAGRRPIDPVLMFKVMFVQRLYGLSDEQAEYQIKDRTSFRDFIGICIVDDVPDARTIWKYREELTRCEAYDELFKQFYAHLQSLGLIVNEGKIIDASFVVSPRQRNTREENQSIKKVREIVCGTTILTRSATKILMLVGQRSAEIHSTVIRTTQRYAVRLN